MRRTIFTDEHEQFRQMVRTFLAKECVPHTAEWLEAGVVSREAWRKAGELGLLGWMVPEEYGGLGIRDFRYSVVIAEEIAATGTQGIALALHNDVVAPYLTDLANHEQKKPGGCRASWPANGWSPSRCPNPGRARTSSRSRPPPAATAIITSSTGRRPSSATASWPTWSSWWRGQTRRPATGG